MFRAVRDLESEGMRPRAEFHETARCITLTQSPASPGKGTIAVVCAGTSDLPVAEEAAVTARLMGNTVELIADVGVAGIHRLLAQKDSLQSARVLIVCAGMEGALPTVVGGLVNAPVLAVPTSVGYGASLRWRRRAARHVEHLLAQRLRRQHRQRLRRRLHRLAHQSALRLED